MLIEIDSRDAAIRFPGDRIHVRPTRNADTLGVSRHSRLACADTLGQLGLGNVLSVEPVCEPHTNYIPLRFGPRKSENTAMDLDEFSSTRYRNGMSEALKRARKAAGLSQQALADAVHTSQPQIRRLENGERKMTKEWAERLAPIVKRTPTDLMEFNVFVSSKTNEIFDQSNEMTQELQRNYRPEPKLLGARDLQVFSSVEGGPGEMTVFSTDPYEIVQRPWYVDRDPEAFGVFLTGDSMEPVYTAGEIIVASPKAPLIKGKGVIFQAEPVGGDFKASLKLYRGQTEKEWLAKQFNPEKDLKFDRNIWRRAYRVLGSFDG